MERLTQWYDDGKIRGVFVKDGYEENALQTIVTKIDECYAAVALLKEYEDTGLTPPEIMELKERDTAKAPNKKLRHRGGFETFHCPNCDTSYQMDRRYTITDEYCPKCGKLLDSSFRSFCANCGQRLEDGR